MLHMSTHVNSLKYPIPAYTRELTGRYNIFLKTATAPVIAQLGPTPCDVVGISVTITRDGPHPNLPSDQRVGIVHHGLGMYFVETMFSLYEDHPIWDYTIHWTFKQWSGGPLTHVIRNIEVMDRVLMHNSEETFAFPEARRRNRVRPKASPQPTQEDKTVWDHLEGEEQPIS